jgi:ribosome-associated protein
LVVDDLRTPGGVPVSGRALHLELARSGGPGGQHVNTTASKVTVVLDVAAGLPEREAARVGERHGPTLRVSASTHRSQHRNRADALERLLRRIDEALEVPTARTPTRVPPRARRRRAEGKARRSQRLQDRRVGGED